MPGDSVVSDSAAADETVVVVSSAVYSVISVVVEIHPGS